MNYFTTTSKPSRRAVDCVIVGIYERGKLGAGAADIDAASKGQIKALIKSGDLSTQLGNCRVLTNVPGTRAPRVAVVGLGKLSALDVTGYRRAVSATIAALSSSKTGSVLNTLTLEDVDGATPYYLARHAAEVIAEALYAFDEMKSGKKKAGMPLKSAKRSSWSSGSLGLDSRVSRRRSSIRTLGWTFSWMYKGGAWTTRSDQSCSSFPRHTSCGSRSRFRRS